MSGTATFKNQYTIPWVEGVKRTVAWLDARGKIENSDDEPFDDKIIAEWNRLCDSMAEHLQGVDG